MKGEYKECFIEFGENIVRNVGKKENIWWFRKKAVSLRTRNVHADKVWAFRVVKQDKCFVTRKRIIC